VASTLLGPPALREQTKGVAYTGVNIEDLRLLPIPIPPIEEQQEIVRRVEALFRLSEHCPSSLKTEH